MVMKALPLTLLALLAGTAVQAFPPAPAYSLFGTVRDENGRPLDTSEGTIIVSGVNGEITRSPTDTDRGRGINYRVHIPMDGNTTGQLFQVSALRPQMPFTMRVLIRNISYVPIQMTGRTWLAGTFGGRDRLDLTLGVDADGDGLPDSWERSLIDSDQSGTFRSISDVKPGDDSDGDGLTNLQEYQLGTYALDRLDGVALEISEIKNGYARLKFAAVAGRTYRIRTSPDLVTWQDEDFSLQTAAGLQPWLRAADTSYQEIFVPVKGRSKLLFKLYAE